jgi:hypothetical protein
MSDELADKLNLVQHDEGHNAAELLSYASCETNPARASQ